MNVSWIKLKLDIFNDEKMKIIQAMPEGDTLLVIWLNLLVLAGKCNADGLLLVTDTLEYTPEMLSSVMGRDLKIVNMALSVFEKLGMIDYTDTGVICISNFSKHQNIEGLDKIKEQNRLRKQRQREREKKAIECKEDSSNYDVSNASDNSNDNVSRDSHVTVTQCHATDIDKEIEKEYIYNNMSDTEVSDGGEVTKNDKENIDYARVQNSFNNICKDLPTTRTLSPARKRGVKAVINHIKKSKWVVPGQATSNTYEVIDYIFKLVHSSDFLSGRTSAWQNCSFDWIMNVTNVTKIYDLNYANKPKVNQPVKPSNNQFNNFSQRNYTAEDFSELEKRLLGR